MYNRQILMETSQGYINLEHVRLIHDHGEEIEFVFSGDDTFIHGRASLAVEE